VTAPLPVQEIPAPRRSARVFAAAACLTTGLLSALGLLGAALIPSHPMALADGLVLVLIGAAGLGSILNPRKARP
jgi:hypothetical protein